MSRHTVHEALRRLRREGVIHSSRGRSSIVAPEVITQEMGTVYSLFHELEARSMEQGPETIRAVVGLVGDRAVEYRRTLVRGSRFSLTAQP